MPSNARLTDSRQRSQREDRPLRRQALNGGEDARSGRGRRLFGVLPSRVELEIVRVNDTREVMHVHYRVGR